MGRMPELDLDLQQMEPQVTDRFVSSYISEMEYRLEAPYRAGYVVGNFLVSLILAAALGFMLLVL